MSQDNFNVIDVESLVDESILTKKIYGRCKHQDCLKPVDYDTNQVTQEKFIKIQSSISNELFPITSAPLIDTINPGDIITFNNSVKSLSIKNFFTEIKVLSIVPPGAFSLPGYYDVTVQYTFTYDLYLYNLNGNLLPITINSAERPYASDKISAKTIYTKLVSLEGGIVDSKTVVTIADTYLSPQSNSSNIGNTPYAYVQAIANPLGSKIGKYNMNNLSTIPTFVYQADIIIGLFTLIELYRITNISVATNGPIEVPQCEPSISSDPCDGFSKLMFPYDDFDPPYGKYR